MPHRSRWASTIDALLKLKSIHTMFEGQFKRSGSAFLFRYRSKGEGYRLSRDQRDQLCQQARRNLRIGMATILLIGVSITGLLVWQLAEWETDSSPTALLVAVVLAVAGTGIFAGYLAHRVWQRPLKYLQAVTPDMPALSPKVARRQFYLTRSYWMLASLPVVLAGLLLARRKIDIWHGYGIWLWLVPVGGLLLGGWMAWQKWRSERDR